MGEVRLSSLVVAALVKNEAKKYWQSALAGWSEFADRIVVLDDNSTDKTVKIAKRFPKVELYSRYGAAEAAWGSESHARKELWDCAMECSEPGDYVLWLDADMIPLADPRDFAHSHCDTFFFVLYDLWGRDENDRLLYRDDVFWCAHARPRPWMIKRAKDFAADWPTRGIHSGHLPENWRFGNATFVPPSHGLLHYGYFDERDRAAKHAQYLSVSKQLGGKELAHARTIVDPEPTTRPLFEEISWPLVRAT